MTRREREAAAAVCASLLLALPFLGEGFHIDEPFFLDRARELLAGGSYAPHAWSEYNNNPPVILWLLAAATRVAGENEAFLRALFLPLDALAAASMYLLFARFLKRPLAWTLLALLSPAYVLNMGHLMAEKPAMAFGLAGLYALVRGAEEEKRGWLAASAGLLGAAVLSKYAAVALLPAAGWYLHRRGSGLKRAALYLALAALLPALYLLTHLGVLGGVATTMAGASGGAWARPPHRLRSLLAFMGGLAVLPALWPAGPGRRATALAAAAAALLFLPALDTAAVRPFDRVFGAWLAAGGLGALLTALFARRAAGRDLWLPWLLASTAVAAAYWSVMARVVMFALPPLTLALGAAFEARAPAPSRRALPRLAACAAAVLSLCAG